MIRFHNTLEKIHGIQRFSPLQVKKILSKIPPMMISFLRFQLLTETPVTRKILTRSRNRQSTGLLESISHKIHKKITVAKLKDRLLFLFLLMVFLLELLLTLLLLEQTSFPKSFALRIKSLSSTFLLLSNFLSHSKVHLHTLLKKFPLSST